MIESLPDGRIRVLHRTGQWCPGWKSGNAAAYDLPISPEYRSPDQTDVVDRCYLLLDQGIQLTRPNSFAGRSVEGWWYIDLVAVDRAAEGLVVHDRYVDFLVAPDGDRYGVLDLDDLADALAAGTLSPEECSTTLRQAQRFVDRHLRYPPLDPEPPEFPPSPVLELARLPPFG